ncbi:MAG: glycosyltransferase, partial [Actinomycetota bacterium]
MPERARGVLIVAASLDEKGGLQGRTLHVARLLARHRPVTMLTWRARRFPSVEHVGSNLKILRLPSVATWARDQPAPVAWVNTAVSLLTGAVAALWIRSRWDVAVGMGLVPEGVLAAACGVALRKRTVVQTWLPGPRGNVARLESSPLARLFKRMLRSATFLGETDEMVTELQAAGFAPDRIRKLGWGVELDRFVPADGLRPQAKERLGIPSDRRVLAYWGRFDLQQKRLDVLLEAWRRVSPQGWQLLLAGDGPDRDWIEDMGASLDPNPVILGWQE